MGCFLSIKYYAKRAVHIRHHYYAVMLASSVQSLYRSLWIHRTRFVGSAVTEQKLQISSACATIKGGLGRNEKRTLRNWKKRFVDTKPRKVRAPGVPQSSTS